MIWGPGDNARWNIVCVPEFILDIYACLYQEVDLHVMISVMYANVSVQLNCAPSAYLRRWTR